MKKTKLNILNDLIKIVDKDSNPENMVFNIVDYISETLESNIEDLNLKAKVDFLQSELKKKDKEILILKDNIKIIDRENSILLNKKFSLLNEISNLRRIVSIQDTSMNVAINNLEVGKMKNNKGLEMPFNE